MTKMTGAAVAILYSRREKGLIRNKVVSVVVDGTVDDNKHDIMASAYKYLDANRSMDIAGYRPEAWDITCFEQEIKQEES